MLPNIGNTEIWRLKPAKLVPLSSEQKLEDTNVQRN